MISIYIDTNVFLDFYQSAKDRMAIFQELLMRADYIVVPEQTFREFRRNRASRLIQLADQVDKSANVDVHTTAIVREIPDFAEWLHARDLVKLHAKTISKRLRTWAGDESSDPVYQQFLQLYSNGTKLPTPQGALPKAQARKLLGDPPTSQDKYTIGDELIWETLLELCQSDLIIVSRDKTFLRNETLLRSEFEENGKRRLVAVTDKLGEALQRVGMPSTPIDQAEKDATLHEATMQVAIETGICPNCNTEMDEEGFEGGDGDSAWWLTCRRCNLLAFPTAQSRDSSSK